MRTDSSAHADTQMMGIVHRALQRDLSRGTDALSHQPWPHDVQRVAIAQHMRAMMDFLHAHHTGEDAWLWPTMRRLNPSAAEILDQMDADHLAIAPYMAKVAAAAATYEQSANAREELVRALSALRDTLDPHLHREEIEMMPIVARTLTAAQWDTWEQDYYLKSKTRKQLGLEGHWLIDGGDRAAYDHVVGKVNPVLHFVLLRVFGPQYRRACATRWGADVKVGPKMEDASTTEQPETVGSLRRPWRTRGEVSLHIDAPPERLYDLVADIRSAPARSKEVRACHWLNGPPPGSVGSRFRGRNRAGLIRWSRVCEVVTATRGQAFVFRTVPAKLDLTCRDATVWGYLFEPDSAGTLVTHHYTLVQPPLSWFLTIYGILMPHHRDARPALRHTLEQLKASVEET